MPAFFVSANLYPIKDDSDNIIYVVTPAGKKLIDIVTVSAASAAPVSEGYVVHRIHFGNAVVSYFPINLIPPIDSTPAHAFALNDILRVDIKHRLKLQNSP